MDFELSLALPIKNTFINFDEIPSLPLERRFVTCPPVFEIPLCLEPRKDLEEFLTECRGGGEGFPDREQEVAVGENRSSWTNLGPTMPLPIKNTFISFDEIPPSPREFVRFLTSPPCMGSRDFMVDFQTDCSTDDEHNAGFEQQRCNNDEDEEDADEAEQANSEAVGDEGVKKDFGTEVSSKSFCRAASPGHEQDVKPHMDSKDLTTEDTAQCTDVEDWQYVPNRKGRKKPTPTAHAVAKSRSEDSGKDIQNKKGCKKPTSARPPVVTSAPNVSGKPSSGTFHASSAREQQNVRGKQRTRETWIHCRFEVGIEDSTEFPVCRRLIGANGQNMKFIVEESGCARVHVDSKEPVTVCVSAPSRPSIDSATALISDLLFDVQEEYRKFCSQRGHPVPKFKKFQHYSL